MNIKEMRKLLFHDFRNFIDELYLQEFLLAGDGICGKIDFAHGIGVISDKEFSLFKSLMNDIHNITHNVIYDAMYRQEMDMKSIKKSLLNALSYIENMNIGGMYKYTKDLYTITEVYYGKFNQKSTVAFAPTLSDAKLVVESMLIAKKGRPFDYIYERTYSFDEVPYTDIADDEIDTSWFCGNNSEK